VLCDRYVEDTLLDFRRKFSQEHVDDWLLWRLMVKLSARPDYRILLLVTPVESVRRSVLKNEPFPDSIETLAWRYDQYREMARTGEWLVIDCSQPFSIVRETIRAALQK
jgi:dTMP kinase